MRKEQETQRSGKDRVIAQAARKAAKQLQTVGRELNRAARKVKK